MSASNMVIVAVRLKTLIEELVTSVAADADHATNLGITRTRNQPQVEIRKRRNGRGRETGPMRIQEGITIVPMEPIQAYGTNERDGVGYRFLVALVRGSVSDEVSDTWPLPVWEQAIRQRFQNKRLGSLGLTTGCEIRTTVNPGKLPDWAMLDEGMDGTFLVVTEYIRENRRT